MLEPRDAALALGARRENRERVRRYRERLYDAHARLLHRASLWRGSAPRWIDRQITQNRRPA